MHLLIVTAIVFVMFLAWQLAVAVEKAKQASVEVVSPYAIEIARATYGQNCTRASQGDEFSTPRPSSASLENNVLPYLSQLCGGRSKCSLMVSSSTLGDPMPACLMKELFVEYRCFKVDRPWRVMARDGSVLEINCDRK